MPKGKTVTVKLSPHVAKVLDDLQEEKDRFESLIRRTTREGAYYFYQGQSRKIDTTMRNIRELLGYDKLKKG